MIKAGVVIQSKKAAKVMRDIYTKDIPRAKASAFNRAGESGSGKAATAVAKDVNVPRWMIAGAGGAAGGKGKKKGSRIARSRYNKKIDGIFITFRHTHLNPTGTKHKKVTLTRPKRGSQGVKAGRHFYPESYAETYKYSNAIYGQGSGSNRLKKIELGQRSVGIVRGIVKRVVPAVFKKRFEYEFNRKVGRRGAR
ncbi:hypothetical protein DRH27_05485 [Candidatus Falkowbacteria bacterium]|nr:MAG: hypothetical protein DRH27_05485 [Candidatus Falkowbacteria bacterium]